MDVLRLPDGTVISCRGRDVLCRSPQGDVIWIERADLRTVANYLIGAHRRDGDYPG